MHVQPKDPRSGVSKVGQDQYFPASSRNRNHGQWIVGRYAVPEQSIVRIRSQHRELRNGPFYENASLLIRMREQAALRVVRVTLTQHEYAATHFAYFEGRFDIVRPEWFEQLGYVPVPAEAGEYIDGTDLNGVITVEVSEAEISRWEPGAVRSVVTSTGQRVELPTAGVRRKLRIPQRR
jgi:hypothetical protein